MPHETPATFCRRSVAPKESPNKMAQLGRFFAGIADCFIAPIIYA
jgi:hypothetical protein